MDQTFDPTKPSTVTQPQQPVFDPTLPSTHSKNIPAVSQEETPGVQISADDLDPGHVYISPEMRQKLSPGRTLVPKPVTVRPGAGGPPSPLPKPVQSFMDTATGRNSKYSPSDFSHIDPATMGATVGMMVAPEYFGPEEGIPLLMRVAARMALSGTGAAVGRATTEAATPDFDFQREGTPLGRAGSAFGEGAAMEGIAGVAHGARVLREAQASGEAAAEAAGGPPPTISQTANKVLIRPFTTKAIDMFAGPPKIYPSDPNTGTPETDISQIMGPGATAGQVRGSKLLTSLEGWLRSTFGGRPIENTVKRSSEKLTRDVQDILAPFGTPPTERQAGQVLLAPERQGIRQDMESDVTAADRYHQAVLRQRNAEETAARYQQQAQEAAAEGAADKAMDLRMQANGLLVEAQNAAVEAEHVRNGVYGAAGPIRTPEQAGTITRQIHQSVEAARDQAVDEAYAHVDDVAQGVQVSLEPLVNQANKTAEQTPEILAAMNPQAAGMTGAIQRTGVEDLDEEMLTRQKQIEAFLPSQRALSSGAVTPQAAASLQHQLAEAFARAGVSPQEVQARELSFTQARRLRSELGRISYKAQGTNPSLSYWAGQYKDILDSSMQEAAEKAGSEAHTALANADDLFKHTKRVFEEGVLGDLAGKDQHQAVAYLLGRDSQEIATVFKELGPEAQQAIRSALIDQTLKDPATGTWRTGKQLQAALNKIRPEVRAVVFGDLEAPLSRVVNATQRGESAVNAAGKMTGQAEQARQAALREGVNAMRGETKTATAAARTQTAAAAYQDALKTARDKAATREAGLDPIGAFQTLITPRTDPAALALQRQQVTEMLGKDAWAQVQARWLHDQLGDDLPGLMSRLEKFRPETVKELIPDSNIRNRVYQLARVADHLAKAEPNVSKWVFMSHLSSMMTTGGAAAMAATTGHPIIAAGMMAGTANQVVSPFIISRILADPHAGAAFVSGLRAGAQGDTAMAIKLANEVGGFLKREGLANVRLGGPSGPPLIQPEPEKKKKPVPAARTPARGGGPPSISHR